MIKTLTAVGNSLGLIIDKPILELLGIDKDTRLEVRTDGEGLIIRPLHEGASASSSPAAAAGPGKGAPSAPLPPTSADPGGDLLDELDDVDDLDLLPAAPPPPARPATSKGAPPPPPAPPPTLRPATSAAIPSAKSRADSASAPAGTPQATPKPPSSPKSTTPEVVVELKGEELLRVPLTGQELVIGREHTADVHLDDRALSRKHAKIEKRGAALWVSDLGSANGTYVNGEKVTEPRPLLGGDVIGVGHYKVFVEGALEAGEKTSVLTLTGPEGTHRFALVGEQIVIGRSQSCDISIGHKSISRRHVRILKEGDDFVIEDLGSQNGCKLNGKQLKGSAPFGVNDRVDICDFSLSLGFLDEEADVKGAASDGPPRRPATMLIDKSAMAQAAYVDGDFENVRSRLAPGTSQAGPAKADTGEYEAGGGKKKAKSVRPKRR